MGPMATSSVVTAAEADTVEVAAGEAASRDMAANGNVMSPMTTAWHSCVMPYSTWETGSTYVSAAFRTGSLQ